MTTATWKKNTSKVGGKNKNGSLFVLAERLIIKPYDYVGLTKHRREPGVVYGLVFVECGQSHFRFTNKLSLCIPVCLNTLMAALLLRHPQISFCVTHSLLSHFSSRHVLSAPFSGHHHLLFASATKMEHLTIFKHHQRGICLLYGFCISLLLVSPHLPLIIMLFKKMTKTEFIVQRWLQKTKPAQIKEATAIKAH